MAPATGRMHPSHMSNPFAHLNPPHAVQPTSQHYPSQSGHVPAGFSSQQAAFPSHALNGGISPFNPTSAYGGSAFSTGASAFNAAGPSAFNGALGGQGQGLASVAAQQGFARGAAMQEHTQQADAAGLGMKHGVAGRIREVWKQNLDQEFDILRELILKYPFVSMDAEFPGIVARPIGNFAGSKAEYHYQTLRCNVDILKPIQIGITLWAPDGELPPQHPDPSLLGRAAKGVYANQLAYLPCTWVFNLHFNVEDDMYSAPSIDLLKSSGVDFPRHDRDGIPMQAFGAALTMSGLPYSDEVSWLSFHSGYDFGYLRKILSDDQLPSTQAEFSVMIKKTFPKLWDIKYMLRHAQRLRTNGELGPEGARIMDNLGTKSGLQDLADELGCVRHGNAHTGGSDAWLTGSVFWAMRQKVFGGTLDDDLADQIYGLHGVPAPASQQYRDEFFAIHGTNLINGPPSSGTALQGGAQGYTPTNHPSTPTGTHAGLSSSHTPGAQQQQSYAPSGTYGAYSYNGQK